MCSLLTSVDGALLMVKLLKEKQRSHNYEGSAHTGVEESSTRWTMETNAKDVENRRGRAEGDGNTKNTQFLVVHHKNKKNK